MLYIQTYILASFEKPEDVTMLDQIPMRQQLNELSGDTSSPSDEEYLPMSLTSQGFHFHLLSFVICCLLRGWI